MELNGHPRWMPRTLRKRRAFECGSLSQKSQCNSQKGQALLEYALMISVAAMISLGFVLFFDGTMRQGITRFNAVLERELASGSWQEAPLQWEN